MVGGDIGETVNGDDAIEGKLEAEAG